MGKLCICQICNCGRHKCPHRPVTSKGDKPCLLTEYAQKYHPHPFDRREAFKPAYEPVKGAGPMADATTNRLDYIAHPLEKPFVHAGMPYVPPAGDIDGLTSYKKDYTEKYADRAKPIRQDRKRQVAGKFEGLPTYKHDYREWEIPMRERGQAERGWTPPRDPFKGQSTMKRDFIGYKELPRQSCRPDETSYKSGDPLSTLTDYRQNYIPHAFEARYRHEPEKYNPNRSPFDGLTTHTRDYTPKDGALRDSCKPDIQPFDSGAPFNDDTTNRVDFKKWPMDRPFVHQPDQYVKPPGNMDMNTTSNIAYRPHAIRPRELVRPKSSRKAPGEFDGTTNYTNDYRKWSLGARPHPTGGYEYQPPCGPFEGTPTYKAHYVPHQLMPSHSCKPENQAFQSDGNFDDNTMYRIEYTPKKMEPCPAAILEQPQSTWRFTNTYDSRGHMMYKPISESLIDLGAKPPSRAGLQALSVS
ncbi:stabilizer of axonemal microtubules 1-like isoform X2 [Tubulanus polymorphus]|uniref:stabilizer of axonemal microtubules 1-like isoform X2 n=1 Tax=Tubulanus polymorphus TaxID=672921 RepID=UPI003DA3B861